MLTLDFAEFASQQCVDDCSADLLSSGFIFVRSRLAAGHHEIMEFCNAFCIHVSSLRSLFLLQLTPQADDSGDIKRNVKIEGLIGDMALTVQVFNMTGYGAGRTCDLEGIFTVQPAAGDPGQHCGGRHLHGHLIRLVLWQTEP